MNTLRKQQKELAIELMNKLDIYKPYIKAFKDNNTITLYENMAVITLKKLMNYIKTLKSLKNAKNALFMRLHMNILASENVMTI